MNRLLNNKTLSVIFKILICIAIAKGTALASFVFLPKSGVDTDFNNKDIVNFRDYYKPTSGFSGGIADSNTPIIQVGNLKLLAVYKENNGKNAFVVINDGSSSEVLKTGDKYKQYRIHEIKADSVSLMENGKEVWIGFAKSTLTPSSAAIATATQPSTPALNTRFSNIISKRMQPNTNAPQQPSAQPEQQEEYTSVLKRTEIEDLMANPDAIFKNIGFKEVMKDGKLDGFKVLSINRNSPLAKLGIRAGDVIQSFNGIKLDNYSSVLQIYNNAKSYNKVRLEVMRSNEKKEFEYEIY
ncbi:MAG: PDZ domain-containing protein [Campylobacteraceae bacterium]|jgi:type II secretion system protein C|nr:PDZ domain-containing protein [Campylobacteraceae bacterium]